MTYLWTQLMNHCGTCKHWGCEHDRQQKLKDRVCTRIKDESCSDDVRDSRLPMGELAAIECAEGWADMLTSWEFGCVLHELKEAQ